MNAETITLLGLVATLCSIMGYLGGKRREAKEEGQSSGALKADIEYIKRRSDDMLLEQKDTNKTMSALSERMTRVEESTKQAHKRLDRIEEA